MAISEASFVSTRSTPSGSGWTLRKARNAKYFKFCLTPAVVTRALVGRGTGEVKQPKNSTSSTKGLGWP